MFLIVKFVSNRNDNLILNMANLFHKTEYQFHVQNFNIYGICFFHKIQLHFMDEGPLLKV